MKKLLLFVLFIFALVQKISMAGEPQAIFGDWYFFKYVNDEQKLLCYIISLPKSRYDNFTKRGQSFFSVVQDGDTGEKEVYLSIGQNYNKKILSSEIEINKFKFPVLMEVDRGWTYTKKDDKEIAQEIQNALFFSVIVNYENNKNLLDIYSSTGFTEAYDYLTTHCM